MESYFIDGSHHLLHEVVCCHQKYRSWHYGILLPSNDPNSLAALLKLTDEAYRTFMCKHRKPGQFHVSVTKFIHEFPHILNFIPFEIQFRRRDRNGSNLKFHTVSICDLVFFHPSISFCHSQTHFVTLLD